MPLDQALAVGVGGEGLDPELAGQREHALLGGPRPLAAHLDHLAVADVGVQQPPAHPVSGLDDQDGSARPAKLAGCGQARQACPDHGDVGG